MAAEAPNLSTLPVQVVQIVKLPAPSSASQSTEGHSPPSGGIWRGGFGRPARSLVSTRRVEFLDFTRPARAVSARAAANNKAQRLAAGDLPGGRAVQHVTAVQRVFEITRTGSRPPLTSVTGGTSAREASEPGCSRQPYDDRSAAIWRPSVPPTRSFAHPPGLGAADLAGPTTRWPGHAFATRRGQLPYPQQASRPTHMFFPQRPLSAKPNDPD